MTENFTIKADNLFAFLASNLAKGPKLLARVIKKLAKIANIFFVIFTKMIGTNAKYFANIIKRSALKIANFLATVLIPEQILLI